MDCHSPDNICPLGAFKSLLGAYVFGGIFVIQYVLQPLGISPNLLAMLPYLSNPGSPPILRHEQQGQKKDERPGHSGRTLYPGKPLRLLIDRRGKVLQNRAAPRLSS